MSAITRLTLFIYGMDVIMTEITMSQRLIFSDTLRTDVVRGSNDGR